MSKKSNFAEGLEGFKELKELDTNAWEFFEYIRAETKHEHSLLISRVTWYITCQSFLLTVYAVSYCNSRTPNWFSNVLLPLLAIAITVPAYYMIRGATETIKQWSELRVAWLQKYFKLCPIFIERWYSDQKWSKLQLRGFKEILNYAISLLFMMNKPENNENEPKLPKLENDIIHGRSLWFPQSIPFLFAVAWIAIAFFSWQFPWIAMS
jgi:hypothetical protein